MQVTAGMDIEACAAYHRVRFVRKDRWWLTRLLGWFFRLVGYDFMGRAWTTIGRTVAYPVDGPDADLRFLGPDVIRFRASAPLDALLPAPPDVVFYLERLRRSVEHEFHHVLQFERLWHVHSLLYLLGAPLPFLLAWYRWRAEREAYLHEILHYGRDIEATVQVLWRLYGWCWPRSWMRAWFRDHIFAERLKQPCATGFARQFVPADADDAPSTKDNGDLP
jgi:hypothetical protein